MRTFVVWAVAVATVLAGSSSAGSAPAAAEEPPEQTVQDAGTVTVTGSGFGHGVGMSQYGALGMARDGASARTILKHFYSGTTVASVADDVDLKVNVVDRGASVDLTTAAIADGGGAVQLVTGGGRVIDMIATPKVTVTVEGDALAVTMNPADGEAASFTTSALTVRWSGARGLKGPASALVVNTSSANAASTSSKLRSYRYGVLRLVPVQRSESDQQTRTRIEGVLSVNLHREYLRGIAEVPQSWPMAALQAQVIAARNYALTEYRGGLADVCGGCHLWDDARSQVYRGWGQEYVAPRWVAAVTSTQTSRTRGLAVLSKGVPIRAYYSSSSGGRTRDSKDAWGTAVPYLRSVADPWSVNPDINPGYARWERQVPRDKVAAAFGLTDVASIEVTDKDGAGAAVTVTAVAGDGTQRSVGGAALKGKLGLPAPWYSSFTVG